MQRMQGWKFMANVLSLKWKPKTPISIFRDRVTLLQYLNSRTSRFSNDIKTYGISHFIFLNICFNVYKFCPADKMTHNRIFEGKKGNKRKQLFNGHKSINQNTELQQKHTQACIKTN